MFAPACSILHTYHTFECVGLPATDILSSQADDFSSSDDERRSKSPATRGKQASEEFNVLDSFDLPQEARQDKVGQHQAPFFAPARSERVLSYIRACARYASFPTVSMHRPGTSPGYRKLLVRAGECTWTPLRQLEVRTIFRLAQHQGEHSVVQYAKSHGVTGRVSLWQRQLEYNDHSRSRLTGID